MTIDLITVGKTDSAEVASLISLYQKRINRYIKFSIISLPDIRNAKNMPEESLKREEGTMIYWCCLTTRDMNTHPQDSRRGCKNA